MRGLNRDQAVQISNWAVVRALWVRDLRRLYSMRPLILSQKFENRGDVTEFGNLNHGPPPGQSRVQPFIRNFCSISCSVLLLTALLSNLNIYSPFRLQTIDIMVIQPSTCLRLSDNTAGAITWWRRLPEKFFGTPLFGDRIPEGDWFWCVICGIVLPKNSIFGALGCSIESAQ